jgi:hypothetical protein
MIDETDIPHLTGVNVSLIHSQQERSQLVTLLTSVQVEQLHSRRAKYSSLRSIRSVRTS